MSGYLQRLVRSVMQSEATVHPLVGSLYSAPRRDREQGPLSLKEIVAIVDRSESHEEFSSKEPQDIRLQSPLTPASPEVQSPGPALLRPSVSAARPEPDLSKESSFHPLLPAARPEASINARRERDHDSDTDDERSQEAGKRVYTPLVRELPAHAYAAQDAEQRPNRFAPIGTGDKRVPFDRAEREPDEVQIHIGRIEVTAVQQAPARTGPRPVSKGPSLDEYLQGRDRRAR